MITGWALLAAGFTLVAMLRVIRSARAAAPAGSRGVTLLRPVDAPTTGELQNLALRVAGVRQLVVSPSGDVRSDPALGNRKLGHLKAALQPFERALLVADADVAVDEALVDALLGGIDAGADLVWAAPHPLKRGLQRGLLVQSVHSFEVLAAMAIGPPTMCGKAFALSPRAGALLATLPDCIGEDLSLASAAHENGLRVVQAGRALLPESGPPVARFTRWMQVLKAHRPGLFALVPVLFTCTPVLLVAAHVHGGVAARASVALLVALRLIVASVLERRRGLYVAWLGAEALLLWCWLRALVGGPRVTWRGRTFALKPGGALE